MKTSSKKAFAAKVETATEPLSEPLPSQNQKNLRNFLNQLESRLPQDFYHVAREIAPASFQVTALLQHLEDEKRFPVLFFENPLDMQGRPSAFPLLSNVFTL